MRQKITSFIACVCIVVYVAAVGFGAYRIYVSINERRSLAKEEFFELVNTASNAGVLGFMNEPFKEAVSDGIMNSVTLQAAIISGPYGNEYAVERTEGIITWVGDSPRFSTRFGLSKDPFYSPLRINDVRNVTVSAVSDYIDYTVFTDILKNTLLIVLAALALAFLCLMAESILGKRPVPGTVPNRRPAAPPGADERQDEDDYADVFGGDSGPAEPEPESFDIPDFDIESDPAGPQLSDDDGGPPDCTGPQGLYSPHGNISWEAYTKERLAAELHRGASFEQDLVFIIMEFRDIDSPDEEFFDKFAEAAVAFFTFRDLIFEWGERGISLIIPNIDLDQGFVKAEEFHNKIRGKLSEVFSEKAELCIGITSRAGRLVDAERLIFEATQALSKALGDPVSPIVAFKSDPEKYRAFIAAQGKD
ncbi:hypothetical protein [Breznakiella homolactica]|uniref:GGDEF domain-containing protein n=1 Tax=Breznakiella homolactica TaxID=2798577 RepID=A0A7T7XK98_9SPIR|nr:hypothetical protein [Breznakiella homolactica]QQO07965.1 hypothetical protein JFL75_13565 [Breznakiella homolactica]